MIPSNKTSIGIRQNFRYTLFSLIIFVIFLCLLEGIFRMIYPAPNSSLTRTFEFKHSWSLNRDGFRDSDFEEKLSSGRPSAIFLGDSFTAGMGVEPEISYTGLLNPILRRSGFETFNLGRIGTGTLQQREILEKYIDKIKPREVLLFFYWNDVQDSLDAQVKNSSSPDNAEPQIKTSTHPLLPISSNLKDVLRGSVFYRWLAYKSRVLLARAGVAKLDFSYELDFFERNEKNPNVTRGWKLVDESLESIKELCKKYDARFIVIYIPKREQFIGWDKIIHFYHADEVNYDRWRPNKRLAELCTRLGIPLADTSEQMSARNDLETLYYKFDTHFTKKGNEVFFLKIKPYLLEFFGIRDLKNQTE